MFGKKLRQSSSSTRQSLGAAADRDWYLRRRQYEDALTPLGRLTYRQSTFIISIISTTFAVSICCHEVIVEGGFDVRNYVAIAFCIVWVIVNFLLLLGAYLRAPFMMLPWMALMLGLTPIFVIAIVVGLRMIHMCVKSGGNEEETSCLYERHVIGTSDHLLAGFKLVLLAIMLTANTLAGLFVYQFYRMLSTTSSQAVSPPGDLETTQSSVEYCPSTYTFYHRYNFSRPSIDDRQPCLAALADDADNNEITSTVIN